MSLDVKLFIRKRVSEKLRIDQFVTFVDFIENKNEGLSDIFMQYSEV